MRVCIAKHVAWFLLPTVQWSASMHGLQVYWPWMLVLWWGNRGIQFQGEEPEPNACRE